MHSPQHDETVRTARRLFIATGRGLVECRPVEGAWRLALPHLSGEEATCVACALDHVLVGTRRGAWFSPDLGATWRELNGILNQEHVRWVDADPERPGDFFIGTEPARLLHYDAERGVCEELMEVARMREQEGWSLPYSPESGCVRGFAFSPKHAFAAVEVGGLLESPDAGRHWRRITNGVEPGEPMIHPDVHSLVTGAPLAPERLIAATGGGLYRSDDAGLHWRRLHREYSRAAWVDEKDPDRIVFGPAEEVGRWGRILETRDGGTTWKDAAGGLATPWRTSMVERFEFADGVLYAVLASGEIFAADASGVWQWRRVVPEIEDARAVALV